MTPDKARLPPAARVAGEFVVPESRIYSIGHSNHPIEKFLRLLERHRIEVLVDVRSTPASRFAPQFGHARLRAAVAEAGRDYVFLGKELGGRPEGSEYYDEDGHVLYGRRAAAPEFVAGIERLVALATQRRVAMLCSEENPESCHRRLLVARVLARRGVAVDHIRGDGRLQDDAELAPMEAAQGGLFDDGGDAWTSKHPVKPSKPRP
jgi:uncharacterized protein (DUF488 family)